MEQIWNVSVVLLMSSLTFICLPSICPFIHFSIYPSINVSTIHPFFHSFLHSSIHQSIHPFTYLFIHPSIHSTISLSGHPFVNQSIYLSIIHPSTYLPICSFIQLSNHQIIHPSIYPFIYLSMHLSIHPSFVISMSILMTNFTLLTKM